MGRVAVSSFPRAMRGDATWTGRRRLVREGCDRIYKREMAFCPLSHGGVATFRSAPPDPATWPTMGL